MVNYSFSNATTPKPVPRVTPKPTPSVAPTTPTGVPVIVNFKADPQKIKAGAKVTLNWKVKDIAQIMIEN